MAKHNRAGPVGRVARYVLAVCLAAITLPVYFEADWSYLRASLGLVAGLGGVYVVLHLVVSRYLSAVNRWALSVVAAAPVVLTWSLGQGGGPLFGSGEGGTAALTYLTVSFLVDAVQGNAGCEVLALPGLMFGSRADVPCLLLCPIDHAEAATRAG